ncbi:hypothetical protein ACWAT4_21490 [Bradyrhizobium manausense]
MDTWYPTVVDERWDVPENVEVTTKIDDEHGERNVAKLTRKGNLWFTDPKDGMYVYYMPTHWRR